MAVLHLHAASVVHVTRVAYSPSKEQRIPQMSYLWRYRPVQQEGERRRVSKPLSGITRRRPRHPVRGVSGRDRING